MVTGWNLRQAMTLINGQECTRLLWVFGGGGVGGVFVIYLFFCLLLLLLFMWLLLLLVLLSFVIVVATVAIFVLWATMRGYDWYFALETVTTQITHSGSLVVG